MKIAVFASGNGSNFQRIVEATTNGEIEAEIQCLICDQPDAYVIQRGRQLGIPVWLCQPKDYATKQAFEQELLQKLKQAKVELLVLAGYMRIIGGTLLSAYPDRILNLHPALLPNFPGKSGIEDAYNAGVSVTGVTVHYVDQGIDTGKIIEQQEVVIFSNETISQLAQRIHQVEHQLYPKVIQQVIASLKNK